MGLTRIAMNDHGVASLCFPKDLPAETAPASVAPAIAASLQLLRSGYLEILSERRHRILRGRAARHGTASTSAWDRLGPPGAG